MLPQGGRAAVRCFRTSAPTLGKGLPPRYVAPVAPTPECAKEILAARRDIFGFNPGNGLRSGRKILRRQLKGPTIASYYPTPLSDLPLAAVGIETPAREELFRYEQQLNRLGKSRIKGKMRGGTAQFQDKMRLRDVQEDALESVEYVDSSIALPEPEVMEELEAGRTPEEIEWLHELYAEFAASLERPAGSVAAGSGANVRGLRSGPSREAKTEARTSRSTRMRQGLDDKREWDMKASTSIVPGAGAAEGGADKAEAEEEGSDEDAVPEGRISERPRPEQRTTDREIEELRDSVDAVLAATFRTQLKAAAEADPSITLPAKLDSLSYTELKAAAKQAGLL